VNSAFSVKLFLIEFYHLSVKFNALVGLDCLNICVEVNMLCQTADYSLVVKQIISDVFLIIVIISGSCA